MLGLVLATDDGLLHALPGEAPELALPGVRCTALDHLGSLALAAAPGLGVWAHRDGGWARAWEGDARHVRIAPNGDCYVGTEPPALWRSTDGGRTWVEVERVRGILRHHLTATRDRARGVEPALSGLAFPRNALLLALRPFGTWMSRDGGLSWMRGDQLQMSARSESLDHEALDPRVRVLREHPWEHDRLFAAAGRAAFRSDDGGYTWARSEPAEETTSAVALAIGDRALLLSAILSTDEGALFRSADGAGTWSRVALGEVQSWPEPPLVAAVPGADMLFAYAGGSIWASHDRGERWLPVADGLPPAHALLAAL